jgi:hypothetical protein
MAVDEQASILHLRERYVQGFTDERDIALRLDTKMAHIVQPRPDPDRHSRTGCDPPSCTAL